MKYYHKLCAKMNRVIESSSGKHKLVAERYISLANLALHRELKVGGNAPGIAGASFAIRRNWEAKFGCFTPRENPIIINNGETP